MSAYDLVRLNDLPEEILVLIFLHFDEKSKIMGSSVCWKWRRILYDDYLKVWNPQVELFDSKKTTTDLFLEACQRGSKLSVKFLSKKIVERALSKGMVYSEKSQPPVSDGIADIWSKGLILSVKYDHAHITRLLSSYGISFGHREAIEVATTTGNEEMIRILLEEFPFPNDSFVRMLRGRCEHPENL